MQRVVTRTQQAVQYAARRRTKQEQRLEKAKQWERNQTRQQLRKTLTAEIKQARHNQKENWELGDLAPRRDLGPQGKLYGTKPSQAYLPAELEEKNRPEWWHIADGDRVAVVRGRERGKIGTVNKVYEKLGVVVVSGVNEVEVSIPKYFSMANGSNAETQVAPSPIPIEDVRLVYPLPDQQTGIRRDVIIDKLTPINREWDTIKREYTKGDRVVVGTKTIIPWPASEPEEYEDFEVDTLRISVEEKTFRPFLIHPPMPMSVIDELRGKYSKFRTRHEYDFQAKMEAIDVKNERRALLSRNMMTPLQELAEKRKAEKQQQQQGSKLTDWQMEQIGQVIAKEKGIDMHGNDQDSA